MKNRHFDITKKKRDQNTPDQRKTTSKKNLPNVGVCVRVSVTQCEKFEWLQLGNGSTGRADISRTVCLVSSQYFGQNCYISIIFMLAHLISTATTSYEVVKNARTPLYFSAPPRQLSRISRLFCFRLDARNENPRDEKKINYTHCLPFSNREAFLTERSETGLTRRTAGGREIRKKKKRRSPVVCTNE